LTVGKTTGSTGGTTTLASTKLLDAGALFKTQLDGSLTAASAQTDTTTGASSTVLDELVARIKSQLDRGSSLDTVVGQLADSLANQIAAVLGISAQAAHQLLTQTFTSALSATGSGPPGTTNAQRASTLATRFRQVAELATRVTNAADETGTPIRSIAGQRSDAGTAKANPDPASKQDQLVRGASDALAASASSFVPAVTPSVPVVPDPSAAAAAAASPGDGRTVALPFDATPIATGGDTLLGRTLTRALLASGEQSAPNSHSAPAAAPAARSQTAAGTKTPSSVEAYVHAFVTALAQSDGGGSAGTNDGSGAHDGAAAAFAASAPHAATADGASLPETVSFAVPIAHDAVPVTPPAPAPTLPQTQPVDANAVIDQVLRGMHVTTGEGTSTVRLRLVPEQLGDVTVKLVVSGGSVDATLTAHSADAQSALAGAQSQLAKSLADAGLKLQSFTVDLAGGGFAGTGDQGQRDASARQNARRSGAAPIGGTTDETNDQHNLLAMPSFGPPLYTASPDLGALNYLV
jgi:flagellar hook-length control protein FliK